jgi:hypothetical protein
MKFRMPRIAGNEAHSRDVSENLKGRDHLEDVDVDVRILT